LHQQHVVLLFRKLGLEMDRRNRMPDSVSVSKVIGEIYEASYKPEHWPTTLEAIADYTHSTSAALLYQDNELERACGMYMYNIPEEHLVQYSNVQGGDPNFMIMARELPLGVAAAIDHIVPDRKRLEQTYGEEYTKFITKTDSYYHTGGAILFMDEVRSAGIGLQRNRTMGVWKKPQIDKLNTLVPHLQRAITIQKEFIRLQTREQALRRGLDKMLMGLILFDRDLRPVYINPVAESILEYHPSIEMQNDKIYAHENEFTEKIHKALVCAITAIDGSDPAKSSTALGLRHPDCATTLPVLIAPVHGVLHGLVTEGSFAHAVMCLSDPDRSHPIEADKLVAVYELTPAEAEVAISIANGLSADEVAAMNGVAISTVRSQLKAIFRKMGLNHQAELVKVLLTGPFGQRICPDSVHGPCR
jgi:DNA-binding CsgD family transcriptional regulator/PAS domain-containing protein